MFGKSKIWLTWTASLGLLTLPVAAATSPIPGTLNYVEGQVSIDGRRVSAPASNHLDLDQTLATNQGKAEILLTPGVFLRVGDRSSVRMVSSGLTDTKVELLHGEAMVEAAQLFKENNVGVLMDHSTTILEKPGLYAFNADQGQVRVFDGKALLTSNDQNVEVKKGHEVSLAGPLKAQKFDRKASQDPLYAWSNLRSEYEAQASAQSARMYVYGGPGWYGPGWYWNPWWDMYGFVPGAGIIYSPFGWPFYSPVVVYRAPIVGYRGFAPRTVGPSVGARGFARGPAVGSFSRGAAVGRMGGVRR